MKLFGAKFSNISFELHQQDEPMQNKNTCTLGSYTCGQCPLLLKCDILRTDVAKYVHIFCGSNSDIYLAGSGSHFYFSLLGRPFILFPLALKVFLMLLAVSAKSAHLLYANHTSFSNLSFKLLLIHFTLISLLPFSLQLKSELPLTVRFKCVFLSLVISVRLPRWVPPPF